MNMIIEQILSMKMFSFQLKTKWFMYEKNEA